MPVCRVVSITRSTRAGGPPRCWCAPPPHGKTAARTSPAAWRSAAVSSAVCGRATAWGRAPSIACAARAAPSVSRCGAPTISSARRASVPVMPPGASRSCDTGAGRRSWRGVRRVGAVEEIHQMAHLHPEPVRAHPGGELQHAAGVRRDEHGGPRARDGGHLLLEELAGVVRLHEVVDPGAAAAAIRAFHLDELDPGDRAQQLPGLPADVLAVGEVARILV